MAQLGDARSRQVIRMGGNLISGYKSNQSGIANIVDRAWDSLDNVKAEFIRRGLSLPHYDIEQIRAGPRQRKQNSNAAVAGLTGGVEPRPLIDTNALPSTLYKRPGAGAGEGAAEDPMAKLANQWKKPPPPERSMFAKICSGLSCGLLGGRKRTYKKNRKSKKSKRKQSRKM